MTVSLCLLGPFHVRLDQDRILQLSSKKAQALLAYLALEGARPHYREALAGLLWPEHPERAARGSLRQALQDLRRAIGDDATAKPLLLISRETIQINPETDFWLDVAAFEALTTIAPRQSPVSLGDACADSLKSAIALLRGPFMEGFSVSDSPAFEEWLLLRREQLNRQALLTLHWLAVFYEGRAAYDQVLAYARRAIELDPWHEEAHRQIMRALASTGERSAALEQYRRHEQVISRELGVPPDPETVALYERIRDGAMVGSPLPSTTRDSALAAGGTAPQVSLATESASCAASLVAREHELAQMERHLAQAMTGHGRVLLVTGDAGSGKTALIEGFGQGAMAARKNLVVTLGRCSAYSGAGDTYQPFREALRALTGDLQIYLNSEHERRLQGGLPVTFEALAQQGPDLMRLLAPDVSLVERARARAARSDAWAARLEALIAQVSAPRAVSLQRASLCEQVTRLLCTIARRSPLLVILDDLQWADAPSLEMLFYLGRHIEGSSILVVGALRPAESGPRDAAGQPSLLGIADEFQRQWGDIQVDLSRAEGRLFVDAYLDSQPNRLSARFRETLARHTGGNALFTVELVRAMQESGHLLRDGQGRWIEGPSLDWRQLPPRIEGAISQRIGQLSSAQVELLEAASVEGEEFHAEVLARVRGLSAQTVVADLSGALGRQAHLVLPGSLAKVGEQQQARYRFRHGLFQSYLYGRLDEAARAYLHQAVGVALEELYAQQITKPAGQLARHFEAAGQAPKAARYLLEAGQQAAQIGAHREAITCYEKALALLAGLPADRERLELELALQIAMDNALLYTFGWGAPKRMQPLERAYQLGQQLGCYTPAMLRALRSLADLSQARGEYERAIHLASELLLAAERAEAPLYVAAAHTILALCATMQGDLCQAWTHLPPARDFLQHPPHKLTGEDTLSLRPHADILAIVVLMSYGYLDQAREQMERITSDAERDIPLMPALTHVLAATFYAVCHEDRLAMQRAEESLRIMASLEMPQFRAMSEAVLGWVEARAGQFHRGIERLTAALAAQRELGTVTFHFLQRAMLAEAYLAGGETGAARRAIDEALSHAEKTGAHYHDAQLWRLRGEIMLRSEENTAGCVAQDAEACFQRAIEIARRQGARLYELRATVSLARLWARQGRTKEAREALTAIYATFTEGFGTPDLQEAQALLEELSVHAHTNKQLAHRE